MDILSKYVLKHSSCLMPKCEYAGNELGITCDMCQKRMIHEHDSKVKSDVLDEIINQMNCIHTDMIFRYGVDTISARSDAFDELEEWLMNIKKDK